MVDRCLQAMVKNALEPVWEAKFEGTSYGFRPGRGCQGASGKIYGLARPNKTKKWVLDADIRGAFDNISHEYLLKTIEQVPGKELIKQWLKAGYVELRTCWLLFRPLLAASGDERLTRKCGLFIHPLVLACL